MHPELNEVHRQLAEQGYPFGLAKAMIRETPKQTVRFWIIDNSYSMSERDGKKICEQSSKDELKLVTCSRWEELQETVIYHARLAAALNALTYFELLNKPTLLDQKFSIGEKDRSVGEDLAKAISIIQNSKPCGLTPLAQRLSEVYKKITEIMSKAREYYQRVHIIIATDGLPTTIDGYMGERANDELMQILRLLASLGYVDIVIRLCTDDEKVVRFYNDIDSNLELSIDVLDDFVGEAIEVHSHNPWITYGLPLHRCREFGFHDKILDLIDERSLRLFETRHFIELLLGSSNLPDPDTQWDQFAKLITRLQSNESRQFNYVRKRSKEWIDVYALGKVHDKLFFSSSKIAKMLVLMLIFYAAIRLNT